MANTSILAAFERMWQHVINVVSGKADVDHTHNTATQSTSGFLSAEDKTQLDNGGIPIVTASSSDGVTYTATVDGISTLTNGMKITIIPNANSTNVNTKLNVNGLGDKYIRMPVAYNSAASSAGALASWIGKNKPITLEYDGTYWKTISMPRPSALYLYGTVPVASGGTGATTVEGACANLGIEELKENNNLLFTEPTFEWVDTGNGEDVVNTSGGGDVYIYNHESVIDGSTGYIQIGDEWMSSMGYSPMATLNGRSLKFLNTSDGKVVLDATDGLTMDNEGNMYGNTLNPTTFKLYNHITSDGSDAAVTMTAERLTSNVDANEVSTTWKELVSTTSKIGNVLFNGTMEYGDIDTWAESYTLTGDITKYSLVLVKVAGAGVCICTVNNRVDDLIIDIMGVGHDISYNTPYRVFIRLGDGMLVEQKTVRVSGSSNVNGTVTEIIGLL